MSISRTIRKWANEEQDWLFSRGAAPTYLAGGINSGKTAGCCLKGIALLQKYAGSRLGIVRRVKTQLLKTTAETWYQWCLPPLYNRGHRTEDVLTLNNGSKVFFIHLDQPNSLDLLAGLELNFAYVSQAEEISEKAWDLLDVRVGRWTGAEIPEEDFEAFGGRENWPWKSEEGDVCVPPRYIFAEGYVTDEGHWLYDRFAEESPNRQKWQALGYESRIVWSEKNVYAIKQTLQTALTKDEDYIRRFVRPEWGNPEGKIFKISPLSKLQPEPQLVEKILRTMKLHRSLDHGEFSPACCGWHGTDHDGNIFTYREYYKGDALVSQHRREIFELSKLDSMNGADKPKYYSQIADPAIFDNNRGRSLTTKPSWSVADEYTDSRIMPKETAIYWSAAENSEEVTRSRMKEYLWVDPTHRHPVTGLLGAPRLYFLVKTPDYPFGCDKVIREIGAQMRVKAKIADREVWLDDRDENIVDHGYDMEKYFVVSRPALAIAPPVAPVGPGELRVSDYEAAVERGRRRKRFEERSQGLRGVGYGN